MREQPGKISAGYDPEETHVAPLFDEEATEVARPVVPLDDREVVKDVGAFLETGVAPPVYTRAWRRRTHMTVALVLVALAAGMLLGVFGVRLYNQKRAAAQAPAAAPAPAVEESAVTAAPEAPAAEPAAAPAQPPAVENFPDEAGVTAESAAPAPAPAASERVETAEDVRREERRVDAAEGERVAAPRAGAGEHARGDVVRVRRDPSGAYDTQAAPPEGTAAARRAAREEERLRRLEQSGRGYARGERPRREARSIQEIFEGRPESPPR